MTQRKLTQIETTNVLSHLSIGAKAMMTVTADDADRIIEVDDAFADELANAPSDHKYAPPLWETRAAYLADIRWQRETGGITANGMAVPTDDKTQSRLTSAQSAFDKGLVTSVNWKLGAGMWVTLDGTQLSQIAAAVTGHVTACFAAEKTVSDQIATAPNNDALAAMDLTAEFDAAYQAEIGT